MTAYISAYNFLTLRGSINVMQERLEEFTRPGVDGMSFQAVGERAEVSQLQTVRDLAYASSAANMMSSYKALVGEVVTIVDDDGVSWYNMLVLKVTQVSNEKIVGSVGGLVTGALALQTVNWEVQSLT